MPPAKLNLKRMPLHQPHPLYEALAEAPTGR
jgi:hypothetical protein